jgi:nucleotidyltransferase substrate binding protein (TIGR01987 family)
MQAHQPLDFSSLNKALSALQRGWDRSGKQPLDEELRDACIQRFEFSFELAWKMIKRRLERDLASSDQLDGMSFRELMRLAHEAGLIDTVQAWWVFRDMRNLSSHTYDSQVAAQVYSVIVDFLPASQFLLNQLERKGKADVLESDA